MDYRRTPIRIVLAFGIVGMLVSGAVGVAVGLEGSTSSSLSEPESDSPTAVFSEEPLGVQPVYSGSGFILSTVQSNSNSTSTDGPPPHRDPATIESESDLQALAEQLQGSLDGNLAESLSEIEAGDYDQARELLGEEYDGELELYADVVEELNEQEKAALFAAVQADQTEYVDAVEDFETTREAYREARQEGDSQQAREHARELIEASERVDAAGGDTIEDYSELENTTGQDYSERTTTIDERRTDASTTSETVSREEFTETEVSVSTNQTTVAFTDTVRLSGEIEPAEGSVDRHEARILFADQSYTVDIDSDGQFEFTAQPESVWTDSDEFSLQYRPETESTFLGSETTVPLSVSNTATRIDVNELSSHVSYDTPLSVDGFLLTTTTAEGVPQTPVTVLVAGENLATTETTTDGRIESTTAIPHSIPAGETTITVQKASTSRALSGEPITEQIIIEPTDPVLAVSATATENSETEIEVDGEFESPDGRPIEDAEVSIVMDDETVGTLETEADGTFVGSFAAPPGSASGDQLRVTAEFDGESSNLESTTTSTTITLPETLLDAVGLERSHAILIGVGSGIGFIVLLLGVWWWLRDTPTEPTADETGDFETNSSANTHTAQSQQMVSAASDRLNAGDPQRATMIAYSAVRQALGTQVDSTTTATHWEWYRACEDDDIEHLSALQTLTETFEDVTFAPSKGKQNETVQAEKAVGIARKIIDTEST